ncbi:MAG: GAF domain-containing protein [Proteobacteria bacterium]|nr:GAF domain-containing protein [Pseudomonadota bacterium]MCH8976752.1 GAF domain-containing protein [Pseudomonadota bacterium]
MDLTLSDLPTLLINLNSVGVALSAEKDHDRLLEIILMRAKEMTRADGGTLYLQTEENTLKFEIVHTDSLEIRMGGAQGEPISFYPVKLVNDDGEPNMHNVAACAVLKNETINIADAYSNEEFDFTGTRNFDKKTGYRSKSFLTVPMTNHENKIIGVLQLINATDAETGEIRAFSALDQQVVESLASQAAITLTNRQLIEAQKKLFDSFIALIASAIDEKSPYTAGHCRRVPVLTDMIAEACCNINYGPHKDFSMSDEDKYELNVAGWLHDCGKITTPEAVVDKGTKLETIVDRIEMIDTRFEILKRDAEIAALKRKLDSLGEKDFSGDEQLASELEQFDDDRAFIRMCNIGGEAMADDLQQRVKKIAQYKWKDTEGNDSNFLSDDEVYNLNIFRGTLTAEDREIINNHVVATIRMLGSLPYPKHLLNVTEFAGGHHEKMDGTGYPKGLKRDEMSIQARMLGIADIFEALTAADRPYKKAMPMSQALTILGRMKLENHIDPDLYDVFMWEKVYQKYADDYLGPEQCDDYDLNDIPGYVPPPE